MKKTLLAIAAAAVLPAPAQNPIISGQFTADPTARVFNGRMYLYPSHDIHSPVDSLKEWFCMEDYHVFSSDNLTDWIDHGVILTQNNIPWVKPDSYAMWAPDCVEKNGRYYFYFPAAPKDMARGFGIGVAIAGSPEGPFTPLPARMEGVMGIDPCVLVDDDGSCYMYWSGMGLSVARLNDDMMSLASDPKKVEGLPEGFKEGPFAFKRNGIYYLTFPWVRKDTETLAYAVSDNPMGPFDFKGIIMDESPTGCWTNHHSIVEKDGQWYLFYHHNDYSPDMDKRRSARIDSLSFNPDGTIEKVIPTLRGVGISKGCEKIQIDRYSAVSPKGTELRFLDPGNTFDGWSICLKKKGAWVRYGKVDFGGAPANTMTARVRSKKDALINVKDSRGNEIASMRVNKSPEWQTLETPVKNSPAGITDLVLSLDKGADAELDWISFPSK